MSRFIKGHQKYCGCDYCVILAKYTKVKIAMHHELRSNDDPDWYNGFLFRSSMRNYSELKRVAYNLKIEKDEIKNRALKEFE